MPIQTFQVTADIPEGYEPTGEYRELRSGEFGLFEGTAFPSQCDPLEYPVLRPLWQWPEWIKPGCWIALDRGGNWWLYTHEPQLHGGTWSSGCGRACPINEDFSGVIDFTPPPCTDWRQSKRQKPLG